MIHHFKTKTLRCEWQIVSQQVDQYGQPTKHYTVLASWPSYPLAVEDRPNHGYKHSYIDSRWIPNGTKHAYDFLEIRYREVVIDESTTIKM